MMCLCVSSENVTQCVHNRYICVACFKLVLCCVGALPQRSPVGSDTSALPFIGRPVEGRV